MADPAETNLELFHRLAEPASAAVRRRVVELGLQDAVEFRNVHFESHLDALAGHGSQETPAVWDGVELYIGQERALAQLAIAASRRAGRAG